MTGIFADEVGNANEGNEFDRKESQEVGSDKESFESTEAGPASGDEVWWKVGGLEMLPGKQRVL